MIKKQEIKELYYIRAIAALGILIIHATTEFAVSSQFNTNSMYLGIFLNQFFRFGSQVFMMVSGIVIFYNYRSISEFNTKYFYKKKIKYLFLPYIMWTLVYFLYTSYVREIGINSDSLSVLLRNVLLGEGYYHLYFMFLIFQFYLLVPLFLKYFIKPMKERPLTVFIVIFLLQSIILIYGQFFRDLSVGGLLGIFNQYYRRTVFAWFYYFLTGGMIGLHYDKVTNFIDRNIIKILTGYLLVTSLYLGEVFITIIKDQGRTNFGNFHSTRPQTMIYAIFTMAILLWATGKISNSTNILSKVVKVFGTYSLGIYFLHPLVISRLTIKIIYSYTIFSFSRLSSLLLMVSLSVLLTFFITLLIGSTSFRWILIGKIPRFRLARKKAKGVV